MVYKNNQGRNHITGLKGIYDNKIVPSYNTNVNILSDFVANCNLESSNGNTYGLEECALIIQNMTTNFDKLREDHNATIEKHIGNDGNFASFYEDMVR